MSRFSSHLRKGRAPRTDGPLRHFVSPRGLVTGSVINVMVAGLAVCAGGILISCGSPVSSESPQAMEYETSLGEPRERNPIDGQPYVSIPAGRFEMGCQPNDEQCLDHEKPRHWVTISKGFWMGRGEVTVGAYRRFTKVTGRSMPPPPPFDPGGWPRLDHPMVRVLWQDGADYCEWAGGRLPTEAEWEYAARGGAGGALFPWPGPLGATNANFGGNHCLEGADCQPDAFAFTAPAGSFAPNGYGLYDVIGNVWEWISDWYGKDYYSLSPEADPAGPASGTTHVVRGGAWDDKPVFMRLSNRNKSHRNGKIFCLSEDGDTYVIQAGADYKMLGKNSLDEMCMSTPAIAGGSLLIRADSQLYRIQNA